MDFFTIEARKEIVNTFSKEIKNDMRKKDNFDRFIKLTKNTNYHINSQDFHNGNDSYHILNLALKSNNQYLLSYLLKDKEKIEFKNNNMYMNTLVGLAKLNVLDSFKFFFEQKNKYLPDDNGHFLNNSPFYNIKKSFVYWNNKDLILDQQKNSEKDKLEFYQSLLRQSLLNEDKSVFIYLSDKKEIQNIVSNTNNLSVKNWFFEKDCISIFGEELTKNIKEYIGNINEDFYKKLKNTEDYISKIQLTKLLLSTSSKKNDNKIKNMELIDEIFNERQFNISFIEKNIVYSGAHYSDEDMNFVLKISKKSFKNPDDLAIFIAPAFRVYNNYNAFSNFGIFENEKITKLYKEIIKDIPDSHNVFNKVTESIRNQMEENKYLPNLNLKVLDTFNKISSIYPDLFNPKEFGLDLNKVLSDSLFDVIKNGNKKEIFSQFSKDDYEEYHSQFISKVLEKLFNFIKYDDNDFVDTIRYASPYIGLLLEDLNDTAEAIRERSDNDLNILKELIIFKIITNDIIKKEVPVIDIQINKLSSNLDKINGNVFVNKLQEFLLVDLEKSEDGIFQRDVENKIKRSMERAELYSITALNQSDLKIKKRI